MNPDFNKLSDIGDEIERLEDAGALAQSDFDRLLQEARAAVGTRTEFLEGILMTGIQHGFVRT